MKKLFEDGDILKAPIEAFIFDASQVALPFPEHWHYYVEILFVVKGQIQVLCNQEEFVVNEKEMIILPPQAVHSIFDKKDMKPLYYVLKFDPNHINFSSDYLPGLNVIFRRNTKKINIPIVFAQKEFPDFDLASFFDELVKEMWERKYGFGSFANAYISMFMIKVLRIWREEGYISDNDQFSESEEYTIHDIVGYIDEHSDEDIKVEEMAKRCGMSYSYFAKIFKELYGQTCKEYIEFVRLNKVQNLLLFTSNDQSFIASETGFADCSHLIRVFKKHYGITPKQFRKQFEGD